MMVKYKIEMVVQTDMDDEDVEDGKLREVISELLDRDLDERGNDAVIQDSYVLKVAKLKKVI
jgi:hypothetical protein